MNHHSVIRGTVFLFCIGLALFAALESGQALAQERASAAPLGVNVPVGTAFTYQGQLKNSAGNPISDSCGLRFTLYDADVSGAQVGPIQDKTAVSVANGYFTVALDFGGGAFSGDARWLEVAVKCSGDAVYTNIYQRQAITPAPYAVNADLLDGQHATGFASTAHNHWGQSWSGTGTGLTLLGGTTGLSGSGSSNGVYGTSSSTTGSGVLGYATATSGNTYGVFGRVDSINGVGVDGYAAATSGNTFGVVGRVDSTDGVGVYGYTVATSGVNYGVYGLSTSTEGMGVVGYASATSGEAYGVYGHSDSTAGRGVYGYATSTNGITYGVYGKSDTNAFGRGVYGLATGLTGAHVGVLGETTATDANNYGVEGVSARGYGVYGRVDNSTGIGVYGHGDTGVGGNGNHYGLNGYAYADSEAAYGVYGKSISMAGTGVYGISDATAGFTYGVYGEADSTTGTGVYGTAQATSGTTVGVYGQSNSTGGYGLYGLAGPSTGITAGAYGRTNSGDGFGVAGHSYLSGVGVGAWSYSGNLIEAYSGDWPGGAIRFYIDQAGNVFADGMFISFMTSSLDGAPHSLASIQSPEVWVEDFGRASLVDGSALVSIAPDFAGVANLSVDYNVFLTPMGDSLGLYVTNLTPASFEVREQNGGKSNITFSYRIVARQAGSETVRLPTVSIPATVDVPRQPDGAAQILDQRQPPAKPQPLEAEQPPEKQQP